MTLPTKTPTPSFLRGLKTEILPKRTRLWRIHDKMLGSIWFGPAPGKSPQYRFDAPGGEYTLMYAAASLDGSFVETVLHGKAGTRVISRGDVNRRAWTILETTRPLTVAKLYNEGLLWHGTDARISSDPDYEASRRIALALWREDPTLDGIAYRARHNDGEICYALFERVAKSDLSSGSPSLFAENKDLVDTLVDKYGCAMDDSPPVPRPT